VTIKRRLAVDLRRGSGQEVQDQKDELVRRPHSASRVRFEAVGRPSNNQAVAKCRDVTEGKMALGAEVNRMPKRLTDEQVIMVRIAAWAPAGSDQQSRE
jgi:hypothetical protein